MIELGVGFHPELTGRENVFLNAAIHGLTGQETEAIYRDIVELFGTRTLHRRADQELLVRHVHAIGICDRGRSSHPTSCSSMRSSPSATPISSSDASTRSEGSWTRARRSCSSRTHPTRCGRSAVGRVSSIRELAFDGDVEGGLHFYRQMLHGDGRGDPVPDARASRGGNNRRPEALDGPGRKCRLGRLDFRRPRAGRSAPVRSRPAPWPR